MIEVLIYVVKFIAELIFEVTDNDTTFIVNFQKKWNWSIDRGDLCRFKYYLMNFGNFSFRCMCNIRKKYGKM